MSDFGCQAIVTGSLVDTPRKDSTSSGKLCAKFSILTPGGRVFALAMGEAATDALAMAAGDGVAVSGRLTVTPLRVERLAVAAPRHPGFASHVSARQG